MLVYMLYVFMSDCPYIVPPFLARLLKAYVFGQGHLWREEVQRWKTIPYYETTTWPAPTWKLRMRQPRDPEVTGNWKPHQLVEAEGPWLSTTTLWERWAYSGLS